MSKHPSLFRKTLLAVIAVGSTALAGCIAEVPARSGVDYGYVAGTYGNAPAPTPYAAAPYGDPYYDDSYYGYDGAYYGGGYYYGPSTTFVYSRDHYYPAYGYPSHGNSYRDDYRDHRDRDGDHGGDHHGGYSGYPGHDGNHDQGGNHYGSDGNHGRDGGWNHDRPGRPDTRVGNPAPQDSHQRPVMSSGRSDGNMVQGRGNARIEQALPRRTEDAAPAPRFDRRQQRDRN
ncbi:hypothetical protein [Solimonas terrae]|uniref:DUF3300 domain-containing protein n=1 Tax=Solimonas terrae TaxID=1396819 RepID=A0A6M2BWX6_9GAMM|nr:hypothetical protein [Solimonas terrae]NGY06840.1 hypothetical protein [Solimonas terrae]